ncbi:MAG: AraC family transcriptional regulator [Saprospiraceae bacterium]|nr:AraC family transcriptional regulator [Saprospiraceae bacterium]
MAITTIESYTFSKNKLNQKEAHFEVQKISLDTYCAANKAERSDYYKVYWIEDGSGRYDIDFKEFEINGSGVFCVSPGQMFSVKSEKVKTAFQMSFDKEFYCVEAHGKEIACNGLIFNNVHRASGVSVNSKEAPVFKSIIDNIINELKHPGNAHRDMVESYLRMFLIHTLRLLDIQELEKGSVSHQKNKMVQDFIALVDKHYKTKHSVSDYAKELFISPKSLAKKLKALGYPTSTEMIQERILLEAKRSLKYSQDSIKEIAYDLGFDDPAYFSRLFSKKEGMTPLAYRKS